MDTEEKVEIKEIKVRVEKLEVRLGQLEGEFFEININKTRIEELEEQLLHVEQFLRKQFPNGESRES